MYLYNIFAARLPDKTLLAASSLWCQAQILIKLADFQGAKGVLRRAYNKKTPDSTDKKNIENTLKIGKYLNVFQLYGLFHFNLSR